MATKKYALSRRLALALALEMCAGDIRATLNMDVLGGEELDRHLGRIGATRADWERITKDQERICTGLCQRAARIRARG